MKKILTFFIAAAAAIMFTGCKSLIETLTTSPVFGVPEVMYDGQEYKIFRLSACKYKWETSSDAITIAVKENQDAIAKAKLSGNEPVKVTITATNPDKATEPPVKHDVNVQPWELRVFDKEKDGKEVSANNLKINTTYYIRVFSGGKIVTEIPGGIKQEHFNKITWSAAGGVTLSPVVEEGKPDFTVARSYKATSAGHIEISARLGDRIIAMTLEFKE